MAIAPDSAYAERLAQTKKAPAATPKGLQPTVTIGGAPAGYAPEKTMQPTVDIGGAQMGYKSTVTPNYITGAGIGTGTTATTTTPVVAATGNVTPTPTDDWTSKGNQAFYKGVPYTGVRNGIQFINGYRQDMYNPDGTDRTKVTVVPGSTGTSTESERTLAKDTFANTLALMMGKNEASQPWVQEMYQLAAGFYKSGSTIDEALNFSLYEAKEKGLAPQFTKRFKGVFALQERLQKGEAISVPTIAEFVKAESDMGDIMREAGLGDLATQEFLGDVIGKGKSVLEVTNLISKTFEAIDTAPKSLKDTLTQYFPGVDRVAIAKALLTGPEGYKALQQKVEAVSVLSAAGSQGINVDLATAGDIAARGFNYEQALTGFGEVSKLQRANVLAEFEGGKYTQQQAQKAVFEQSQAEKDRLEALKLKEVARFQGSAGLAPSALRGRNAREIL